MVIDVLKRFSKHVKAETGTTTTRLYMTGTAVIDKLVKALEREWVKTKEAA